MSERWSVMGEIYPFKSAFAAAQIESILVIATSIVFTLSATLPPQESRRRAGMLASSIKMPRRVKSSLIKRNVSGSI